MFYFSYEAVKSVCKVQPLEIGYPFNVKHWIININVFFSEEARELIDVGALNGLFVLGRSMGFIGKTEYQDIVYLVMSYKCCTQQICISTVDNALKKSWRERESERERESQISVIWLVYVFYLREKERERERNQISVWFDWYMCFI